MTSAVAAPLVDTHAHLQDPAFEGEQDEVVARARAAGLRAMICVGYDLRSSRDAVALAARYDGVYAAVGMHPNSAGRSSDAEWDELRDLATRAKVVGLGETGLDNYRQHTPPETQERWFRRHLELGTELGLPVIIHNRQADDRVRAILVEWTGQRAARSNPGVMHCFSADLGMLEACLSLGFMISIAGPVTFKNADDLRAVAARVPLERLVVETDCPYLAPQAHRGERNEPAYVVHTARRLAELRGDELEILAAQTTRNAASLFGIEAFSAPRDGEPSRA